MWSRVKLAGCVWEEGLQNPLDLELNFPTFHPPSALCLPLCRLTPRHSVFLLAFHLDHVL